MKDTLYEGAKCANWLAVLGTGEECRCSEKADTYDRKIFSYRRYFFKA